MKVFNPVEANQSRNPGRNNEKELLKQIGEDSGERVKRNKERLPGTESSIAGPRSVRTSNLQ